MAGYSAGAKLTAAHLNDPDPTGDLTLGDDFFMAAGGVIIWASDTNLYRSASDTLKTDDKLIAGSVSQVPMPYIHAYQTTSVTITASTARSIPMGAEIVDNINGHDNVTNNTRYTPLVAGYYECTGHLSLAPASSSLVLCEFQKNGARVAGDGYSVQKLTNQAFAVNTVDCGATIQLNGTTDFIEMWANADVTVATDATAGGSSSWWKIRWVSP
jgi:hypothetical protein